MKLGVPSKGRLKKEVLSWFNHKGVEIITSEDDRSYAAKVTGFSDIQLFFLPPVEIPTLLSKGVLDLGVTGQDLIEEKIPQCDKYVTELTKLGIGHADLVIAVPEFWVDVSNLEDLDEVAKIFRHKIAQFSIQNFSLRKRIILFLLSLHYILRLLHLLHFICLCFNVSAHPSSDLNIVDITSS